MDAEKREEQEFELLKWRIQKDRAFNCSNYKDTTLKRRISIRMKATNQETYGKYLGYLLHNAGEYEKLIDVLTVNFTEFFRDPETYRMIESEIFPELIARKKAEDKRMLSIWSAGCSNGSEPYTIAIIMSELLEKYDHNFILSLRASDVDERILETAKEGVYRTEALKNLDDSIIQKYFEPYGECYRVRRKLRTLVKFYKRDLISEEPFNTQDVIFCRNVFIYFSKETQKSLFEKFYDSLNRGGYLIIGKTETMHESMSKKFEMVSLSERIFRKKT